MTEPILKRDNNVNVNRKVRTRFPHGQMLGDGMKIRTCLGSYQGPERAGLTGEAFLLLGTCGTGLWTVTGVCLKGTVRESKSEQERDLQSSGLFPTPQQTTEPEPGAWNSTWISHVGAGHQALGAVSFCSPRGISRELDWKWSSQNPNWCPYRVLASQAMPAMPAPGPF